MNEQDFQRSAALPVKRERAGNSLGNGVIQIDIGQDDARVFRIQAQRGTQTVWLRV
ncbi:hypothetical protein D3C85_1343230 [compost metagenome]